MSDHSWTAVGSAENNGGLLINVRMIVGEDNVSPELVGLILHPTLDVIMGATPGTPSEATGPERACELTGWRLATAAERQAVTILPGLPGGPAVIDGSVRDQVVRDQ